MTSPAPIPAPRRTPLPGRWVDLARDGVPGRLNRRLVATAVRRYMLAGHRHGWEYHDVHAELTNPKNRLAVQLATGRRGRLIPPGQVGRYLSRHWESVREFASTSVPSKAGAVRQAERILDSFQFWDTSGVAGKMCPKRPQERAVLLALVTLARQHRTAHVAAPVRTLEAMTGLPRSTVHRATRVLIDSGLIRLVERGTHGPGATGRANIYALLTPDTQPGVESPTPVRESPPSQGHPRQPDTPSGVVSLDAYRARRRS